MEIRKADMNDIEALVENRIEFVSSLRNHEVEIIDDFKRYTKEYMMEHISDNSMVCLIAEDEGKIVATVMVCYYQVLPLMSNLIGNTGYILNVYTLPDYRKRGLASQLLNIIIEESRKRNVGKLYLNATDMGKPVYEKLGFELLDREMVYIIK
jgi:ribosomal protein S18 acetylase RimI-like enzyme